MAHGQIMLPISNLGKCNRQGLPDLSRS
jgi:hypothetical protein